MPEIEILRAGTFTDSHNIPYTFSQQELEEIRDSYDPTNFRAPLIVSHKTYGKPDASLAESELAYGTPSKLKVVGDRLKAVFDKIAPQFTQWVRDNQILSISSSLYPPGASANPTPGKWSLRHIAGLGKEPPAIKGLGTLSLAEFLDGNEGAIAFSEFKIPGDGSVDFSSADFSIANRMTGELMQSLREYLIEKDGRETADRIIPSDMASYFFTNNYMEELLEDISRRVYKLENPVEYLDKSVSNYEENSVELEELQKQVEKLEAEKLEAQNLAIAAQQQLRRQSITSFCESLPEQVTPAMLKPQSIDFGEEKSEIGLVDFMCSLNERNLEFMKCHLKSLPKQVEFGEVAGGDDPETPTIGGLTDGLGDREVLHKRITEYKEKNGCSFSEAYNVISNKILTEAQ